MTTWSSCSPGPGSGAAAADAAVAAPGHGTAALANIRWRKAGKSVDFVNRLGERPLPGSRLSELAQKRNWVAKAKIFEGLDAGGAVTTREKQIRGLEGSLEPPGPLPMHLHTVYIWWRVLSACLPS